MNIAFPEHRLYTVLAALQVGVIMIGTFAIRIATTENLAGLYETAPAMAMWARDWGYLFLLVPAAWVFLSIRSARKEDADEKTGVRIAVGLAVTVLVGVTFWWLWSRSSIPDDHLISW